MKPITIVYNLTIHILHDEHETYNNSIQPYNSYLTPQFWREGNKVERCNDKVIEYFLDCASYYSCDMTKTSTKQDFFNPMKDQNIQRKKLGHILWYAMK